MKEQTHGQYFDVLIDNHPRKGQSAVDGFNLWGVGNVLTERDYVQGISLERFILRMDKEIFVPFGYGVFSDYKDKLLAVAKKHEFYFSPEK